MFSSTKVQMGNSSLIQSTVWFLILVVDRGCLNIHDPSATGELLPFLMEISKDNSRTVKQQKPIVEFIEKPHPLSAATSLEQNNAKKMRTESSYGSQQTECLVEILLRASIPLAGSYLNTGANPSSPTTTSPFPVDLSNVKPSLEVSENGDNPCVNLDLQTGGISQSQSSPRRLESECSHTGTSGLERKEQSTLQIKESEQVAKQTKSSDLGLEVHNDNRESIEHVQLNQGTLEVDGAFEFSKNQMHEAEEVALELMKEVAKLRHLLKKSITNENGSEIVPLNLIQVEQACSESLETEKLAKVCLSQLNCDLKIHCRTRAFLQQVTFSNYIQERSFPTSDHLVGMEKTE